MKCSLEGLRNKIDGLYIYISTDSVYMVCKNKDEEDYNERKRKEEESIRPTDIEWSNKLNKLDSYGHNKFEAEEELMNEYKNNKMKVVSLRLPDVFGPFDTSDRHWRYQLWTIVSNVNLPIYLSNDFKKLSFVFREDVISAILACFNSDHNTLIGHSINIAASESLSLKNYIEIIAKCLSINNLSFYVSGSNNNDSDSDTDSNSSSSSDSSDFKNSFDRTKILRNEYLPSVDFGPVSIEVKIKIILYFTLKYAKK